MAKSTEEVVQLKLNQKLVEEAKELFEELGLDFESAIRLFLRQSVIAGTLPFKIRRAKNDQSVQQSRGAGQSSQASQTKKTASIKKEEKKPAYSKPKIQASDAIINDL